VRSTEYKVQRGREEEKIKNRKEEKKKQKFFVLSSFQSFIVTSLVLINLG
tara:strand:- start:1165 stop:1314 length:150 start_codon:yes stop_codon:yes gene_type:complete